ncbi:MAG: signal recognition particle-docking protein FtsY [Alphaproteobacteria bacterium]|nr:signal recognition particle-docking protein FtsY [Alphaproteobacteria bacterium]
MVFWRRKKNQKQHEEEQRDDKLLHPEGEPDLELPTEYDAEMDEHTRHEMEETEEEIIEELDEAPVPAHSIEEDAKEAEELSDHTNEGGWLSRLTRGLTKSSNKITKGITDLVTKKKLDQDTLDQLEEVLIEADLGPKTAAKIIDDFAKDRFEKEIDEKEIKTALAGLMSDILAPVAVPLNIEKREDGPFVVLVCGVNGAGKTTTIGKYAYQLRAQGFSVMMAAGDTFRAAAVEQLEEWSKRAGAKFLSKDVGADAAAVAYESYQQAKEQGVDVLLLDTAGRLQNKKNLMEELEKIIRVLKKQNEDIPHATLLVLDATTGQNAFSQLETFKEMVNVTGLIVTKLDGSAKGGVLVGLADQFGMPVHAIGIGEGIEDMQPFRAQDYARSLVGIEF